MSRPKRRACPKHGWRAVNPKAFDRSTKRYLCTLCRTPMLSEREYAALSLERNAARMGGR